jgi:hypothetical protein
MNTTGALAVSSVIMSLASIRGGRFPKRMESEGIPLVVFNLD